MFLLLCSHAQLPSIILCTCCLSPTQGSKKSQTQSRWSNPYILCSLMSFSHYICIFVFLTHLTYIHVTLLVPRISVLRGVFPNLDDFALSGFPWNSLISSLFKSSFCSHFRLCILLPCGTSFYFKIYTPLALERLYSHSQGYIKHSKTTYTRKKWERKTRGDHKTELRCTKTVKAAPRASMLDTNGRPQIWL